MLYVLVELDVKWVFIKLKKKKNKFVAMLSPDSANCIMNYNYYSYSDEEIIAMAKEYGIKTSYKSPTGETKYFKKSTLFNQNSK